MHGMRKLASKVARAKYVQLQVKPGTLWLHNSDHRVVRRDTVCLTLPQL